MYTKLHPRISILTHLFNQSEFSAPTDKTDGRTDGPTDGRTDLRTDTTSYRVASTRLKMVIDLQSEPKVHKLFHGLFVAKWLFFTVTYLRSLNSCTLNTFAGVKRTSEYNGI